MNDPFAIQQASVGAARQGMDAPDLQVRIAQLKAQQGQALTPEENRRLGVRMGLETEAARQDISRGLSGTDTVFGPRSTSVYEGLRGTNLDPVLSQARVQSARLASDPMYRALAETRANYQMAGIDPALAGTAQGFDTYANTMTAAQNAARSGTTIGEELAGQRLYQPAPVKEVSAFAPTAVVKQPAPKATPLSRVSEKIRSKIAPTVDAAQLPAFIRNEQDRAIVSLGRPISLNSAARIRADVAQNLAPKEYEEIGVDDLTGHTYASKVMRNARGDVFSVGEPALVKTNPVTEKVDADFAKDYNDWSTSGAVTQSADAAVLRALSKNLPSMTLVSGFVPGIVNAMGIQDYVLPSESTDAAETLRGIAQRGARAVLGSAYTQKEGEDFMNRAFNPRQSAEVNAQRAARMASALEKAAIAKQDKAAYFDAHGTVSGYKGKTFTLADIENETLGAKVGAAASSSETKKADAIAAYRKAKGL